MFAWFRSSSSVLNILDIDLYGPDGLLEYIYSELLVERHLVIVVAEGAGEAVRDHVLADTGPADKSLNPKLPVND
jgi:hypothetical protein